MYMADCMTDPRWQRSYGTFGEDPALISEVMEHIIPRIQGSDSGVTDTGVAVPHQALPRRRSPGERLRSPLRPPVSGTSTPPPAACRKYHMPGFVAAVDKKDLLHHALLLQAFGGEVRCPAGLRGQGHPFDPYGFAYNRTFVHDILRGQMGFEGYINSDTGIVHNMCWGVKRWTRRADWLRHSQRRRGPDLRPV